MESFAADVGFGYTKFSTENGYRAFPSVVYRVYDQVSHFDETDSQSVILKKGGVTHLVGKIALDEMGDRFGRIMGKNYFSSENYDILMSAVLKSINKRRIKSFVIGLPMNQYVHDRLVQSLIERYQKTIDVEDGFSVEIEEVAVRPQPYGGYIGAGVYLKEISQKLGYPLDSIDQLLKLNTLVVDPGTYTLDWLFVKEGQPIKRLSSAAENAGRHRVVSVFHKMIESELKETIPMSLLYKIDMAEFNNRPITIYGRRFDLRSPRFFEAATDAVKDGIRYMVSYIGNALADVNLIIVTGGDNRHVTAALKEMIPYVPIFQCPIDGPVPSIFVNLAGFHEYAKVLGEQK